MGAALKGFLRTAATVLGITLALGVGTFVVANTVFRPKPPKPLWTVADLPKLPKAADNGFVLLDRLPGEKAIAEVPRPIRAILGDESATPAVRWQAAEDAESDLGKLVSANTDALTRFARILRRPAFADDCGFGPEASCPTLMLLHLHQVVEAAALHAAVSGRRAAAFGTTADLLAMDLHFAASGRSVLSMLISVLDLDRSARLVMTLLADPTEAASPRTEALVSRLDGLLATWDPKLADPERAVIGGYLDSVADVQFAENAEMKRLRAKLGPLAPLLFDASDSIRRTQPYYRRLMAYARNPKTPRPKPIRDPLRKPLWWLFNPEGKILIDVGNPDYVHLIDRLRKETARTTGEIHRARAACVKAETARSPAPSPKPRAARPGPRR